MALAKQTLADLRELLKAGSAQIRTGDGSTRGSGFFIDDRLLLTCAHVVKGPKGATVTVEPYGRSEREGTVVEYLPGNDKDLALVEVEQVEDEGPQPAVLLDAGIDDRVT